METIGRYEIVEELGKGAMGLVYKAVDPNIGRTVALKTMRLDVHGLEHDELLRRFKNEARAAGTLNHPNIVTIYDAGEDKGVFYIAMEFIEGESLQHLLNEHRVIPAERIISITRQVCAGLDYAHQHGVIHRDIKPANIMITADGTAKIMDFGIAKAGGGMTSTGQVLGTPNYMAPEQIKGKPLDGRSDLFSVGVMLYEMLTGEKPFVGQNVTTIIYKIVHENPIPPRELDVSIHPGLSAVVTKALSKPAEDRYQRGSELVHDLENFKAFGSDAGATQMFATTVVPSMGDQTLVGSAPAASAPIQTAAERVSQTQVGAAVASQKIEAQESAKVPAQSVPVKRSRWPLYGAIIAIVIVAGSYMGLRTNRQSKLDQLNDPETQRQLEEARKVLDQGMQIAQQATNLGKPSATQPPIPAIPTPPGGFAELTINSQPTGATVQIDGQPQPGVTPLLLAQFQPGKHAVTVSMEGFAPVTRNVDIAAGKKKDLTVQLAAEMGVLNITTRPANAEITVDGKAHGKAPNELKLPVGEHTLALTKEGFQKSEEKITISAATPIHLARDLKPSGTATAEPGTGATVAAPFKKLKNLFGRAGRSEERGVLAVTTKPAGAQVLINGSPALGTTPVRTPIPTGKYKMELRLAGHRPVTRDIVVEKDKVTGIEEIMLPK